MLRKKATKALETDDQEEAVKQWQKLLEKKNSPKMSRKPPEIFAKATPGIASVASAGFVSNQAPTIGRFTVSQPTKFFGDK